MPAPRCYMCTARATSREHVPPKCLFPESKDMGGVDYRVNLMTVPSCEEHNSQKSHDDEFLMVGLSGIIGNNSIGYMHKLGKVDRAIRNSANKLLELVLIQKLDTFRFDLGDNRFHSVLWGTPDIERLRKCFVHIGHGLHQYHFGKRFVGHIVVHLGYLFHSEPNARSWADFVRHRAQIDLTDRPKHGSNPDVFHYQVTDPDAHGLFLFGLTFYGGVHVYLSFRPEGVVEPANLPMHLIAAGIETVIELPSKSYVFNAKRET